MSCETAEQIGARTCRHLPGTTQTIRLAAALRSHRGCGPMPSPETGRSLGTLATGPHSWQTCAQLAVAGSAALMGPHTRSRAGSTRTSLCMRPSNDPPLRRPPRRGPGRTAGGVWAVRADNENVARLLAERSLKTARNTGACPFALVRGCVIGGPSRRTKTRIRSRAAELVRDSLKSVPSEVEVKP